MTRIECSTKLEEITSKGLLSAVIFFKSPISEGVEERHIWASDNAELLAWLSNALSPMRKLSIPFIAYLNDSIYLNDGILFD